MENLDYRIVTPRIKSVQAEHTPEKRKLLCLRLPGNSGNCLDKLTDDAWTLCVTGNLKDAEQMVRDGQVFVGLIMFDHIICESQFEQLNELLSLRGIKWVALLSDICVSSEKIWQLIGEIFFDYHSLPIDRRRLFATLGHAYGMARLEHRYMAQQQLDVNDDSIIGASAVMQQVKHRIHRIAKLEAPVLIMGESGTGKELAAHALHEHSNRRSGLFEAVNCAALPASLIQSELFGHEKGAFTGASCRKIGRFEAANSGTIFLDEIGDLPLELQMNLLRIIEQKVVRRVGGIRDVPIDVRVVAATHVDLEKAIAEGKFREDLYYRLNVLQLKIPPLRERDGDIELLARHFLKEFSKNVRSGVRGFSMRSLKAMRSYGWPGNVRELINCVQQAVALCDQSLIGPEDLGSVERRRTNRHTVTLDYARARSEKQTVISALLFSGNNITLAAKPNGRSPSSAGEAFAV